MVRFSIREDQNADVSIRHKRRRLPSPASQFVPEEDDFGTLFDLPLNYPCSSTASGSQSHPTEDEDEEDEDADDDAELGLTDGEDESESESDDDDDDDDVIQEVTDDVQRTCTAIWRLPVVGDVAVGSTTVEKRNVDVMEVVNDNNVSGALSAVFTDPDVLDCPICLEALCVPVYQCENGHIACDSCCSKCENGHIACDSCCSKVKRKCPSCCMPIGYNRCRAIEKVIESVQVSCKYAQYGCRETDLQQETGARTTVSPCRMLLPSAIMSFCRFFQ